MNELALLDTAAQGMAAQRSILDVMARNVAAAQAATPGHPYQRLVATLSTAPDDGILAGPEPPVLDVDGEGDAAVRLNVRRETGSGDALTEMIAVLDAQRAYEADASVFDTGKRLAERALDIDR